MRIVCKEDAPSHVVSLVGGHAGGMSGLEGGKDETDSKKFIDYNEYRDRPFGLKWGLLLRWKN